MLKRNTQSGREPLCFVFVDRRSAVMSRCLHWEIWDELVSLFLFAHACLKLFFSSIWFYEKNCWQYVCFESWELIQLYVDNIMILWQDKNHHFFNQSINAMREGGVGKAHFSSVSYHFDKFLGALLHKKADLDTQAHCGKCSQKRLPESAFRFTTVDRCIKIIVAPK